jgi:hypothetical protein
LKVARGPEKDVKQIKIARDGIKIQHDGEISTQTRSSSYPIYSRRTQLPACFPTSELHALPMARAGLKFNKMRSGAIFGAPGIVRYRVESIP